MKYKKILISLLILIIFCVSGCTKEECKERTIKQTMYLSNEVLVKFDFEETYDACKKGDEKYKKNEKQLVTNFELVNSKAKTVFNNIDFKNRTLKEALELFEEVSDNNELNIESIDIYTTSKNDYSSYLTYDVNNTVLDKNEIDSTVNKKMPLKNFQSQVVVGMEYYYQNYNFISDSEVYVYTEGQCYGECDTANTYKYTYNYDIKSNKITVTILDGYNSYYIYDFKDDSFKYEGYER